MADAIQLTDWAAGYAHGDAYDPPEVRGLVLRGVATGHPRFPTPRIVATSAVKSVEGRRVTTVSGSVYELVGDPEPGYLEYLKSIGKSYDPEAPIKVVGRG